MPAKSSPGAPSVTPLVHLVGQILQFVIAVGAEHLVDALAAACDEQAGEADDQELLHVVFVARALR